MLDFIVILKLYLPYNLVTMFSYLSFVNSDFEFLGDIYYFIFNLELDQFDGD